MSRRVFLYLFLFCASLTKGWAQESFTLNVGSTGYATLYFDKALSFESFGNDLKAYGVAYVTNGKVTLSRVGVVPPKIGVVVKATQPGTYNIPIVESQDVLVSLMKGVLEDTEITATILKGGVEYTNLVLSKGNQGVAFYRVAPEGGTLAANRAYLQVKSSALPASSVSMAFDDEEATDGINQIVGSTADDGAWYTLQGVQVAQPTQKGVYIHQGRKIIVR